MLSRYTNTLQAYLLGVVLIHLLTSFSRLSAIEMPLELLHDGVNVPKSVDYARRLFPSHAMSDVAVADMDVEMPPNVNDDMDFTTKGGASNENDDPEEEYATRGGMPKWMEMHHQHQTHHQHQQHHPDHMNYRGPTQQKQHNHMNHHHSNRQGHTSTSAPASSSPLRRCSIEISSKIPGICQSMGSIGNACVSGDYIDAISEEC